MRLLVARMFNYKEMKCCSGTVCTSAFDNSTLKFTHKVETHPLYISVAVLQRHCPFVCVCVTTMHAKEQQPFKSFSLN